MISNWFGISRNLLENYLDPFDEITPEAQEFLAGHLKKIHEDFQDHVEKYRGGKIKLTRSERQDKIYDARVFEGE